MPGDRVRRPAGAFLETDDRLVPTGHRPTAGTPFDFTDGSPVGARRADTAFTGLAAHDGRVEARVAAPDGRTTVVWGGPAVRWWQLFTGDDLPERWRRTTIAIEPMTRPPDALSSGEDLVVLEPGARHELTWGLALE